METPFCIICKKTASELPEYREDLDPGQTPEEYVALEEGTYNPSNGHFVCTPCYIDIGMPSSDAG